MKRTFTTVAVCVLGVVGGCANTTKVTFDVDSEPTGGRVEVNGVSKGTTPTQIVLGVTRRWVGLLRASDGWGVDEPQVYVVKVFPPSGSSERLFSQTKMINPSQTPEGGALFFDLRLEPVRPTQPIEIQSR